MIKLCEPLYNLIIHKGVDHIFEQAMIFARSFNIKSVDEENHKILLDQTIPMYYAFTTFFTYWIKEIIIDVKSLTHHETELDIYGKYALSPHNIFLIPSFRNKKIESRFFIRELEMFFEGEYGGKSKML